MRKNGPIDNKSNGIGMSETSDVPITLLSRNILRYPARGGRISEQESGLQTIANIVVESAREDRRLTRSMKLEYENEN